jgi:hypothetical protein
LRRLALLWAAGAILATIVLLIARGQAPGRRELELDLYVLSLGGMALLAAVSWLRKLAPAGGRSELEHALEHEEAEPLKIPELDRLEREVYVGAARAFELHYRLRPVLREIAEARLERRGLRIDSPAEGVRELLGEDLWELTRPDRKPPRNRQAPGPGLPYLEETVTRLEAL